MVTLLDVAEVVTVAGPEPEVPIALTVAGVGDRRDVLKMYPSAIVRSRVLDPVDCKGRVMEVLKPTPIQLRVASVDACTCDVLKCDKEWVCR